MFDIKMEITTYIVQLKVGIAYNTIGPTKNLTGN